MLDIMKFIIDNIWIISAIIIVICLIVLKAVGKTAGIAAKIVIFAVVVLAVLVALGFTTVPAIKEFVLKAVSGDANFNYAEYVQDNYTGSKDIFASAQN